MSDLADKVFLVTGSASGMGLATATTLARRGARLALCDINNASLDKVGKDLESQIPGKVIFQRVDVTDRKSVKTFLNHANQHFGKVHGIANFAGTGGHQLGVEPIWETTPDEFDFIVNLNIRGLFNILGESLNPGFLSELQSVVHVASMFGTRGYRNGAIFAASKHAAVGMVKSAALETGAKGVRVNCLLPYVPYRKLANCRSCNLTMCPVALLRPPCSIRYGAMRACPLPRRALLSPVQASRRRLQMSRRSSSVTRAVMSRGLLGMWMEEQMLDLIDLEIVLSLMQICCHSMFGVSP